MAEVTTSRVKTFRIIAWTLSGALVLALAAGGVVSFMFDARATEQAAVLQQKLVEHEATKQSIASTSDALTISLDSVSESEQAFAADLEERQARRLACLEKPMVSFPHGILMCDVHLAPDDAFETLELKHFVAESVRDTAQGEYDQALTEEQGASDAVRVATSESAQSASIAITTLWVSAISAGVLLLAAITFWAIFAVSRTVQPIGSNDTGSLAEP